MRDFIDRHGVGRWALNFTLIIVAFVALGWVQSGNVAANRDARRDFCVELEQVRTYARDAAQRGLKTVPSLSYYKHHPRERARAVADLERQVMFFSPPLDCDKFAEELQQ